MSEAQSLQHRLDEAVHAVIPSGSQGRIMKLLATGRKLAAHTGGSCWCYLS